ncbi:MAG: reverse transcriptase family protein [Pseudomonadota bacterium]
MSYRLGLPLKLLEKTSENTEKYYIVWYKKKPNGDLRELCKVKRPLRDIQKAIHRLLREVHLPESVHGGVKGKSHITNASVHCRKRSLLNLDLKKYFPSISHHRVYGLFRNELNCSPDVSRLLTKLCTVRGLVPQGSSTSTDIANLVFRKTDYRLDGFAAKYGFGNSRYVDDISFSGGAISRLRLNLIKSIVIDSGFKLNDEKEAMTGRHERQVVTGLLTKYKWPRVLREKKRQWRKDRHIFEKHEKTYNKENRAKKMLQIDGRSNYLKTIENAGM